MTDIESNEKFAGFFKLMNNIWGVPFDESKAKTWRIILKNLDINRLILVLQDLATSSDCRYHPTIKEIVDKYDVIRRQQEKSARDGKVAAYNRMIESKVEEQYYCPICNNGGWYCYDRKPDSDYVGQYACRCLCGHGRDLNQFTECNITKGMMYLDTKTGKEKSSYIPDIRDIFTDDEIEVLKAARLAERASRENMTPDEILQSVKRSIGIMTI